MIKLYRAMCQLEYDKTSENSLSFDRNREKPFGTKEFVFERVLDGNFNNSKYKQRYTHLISIEFDEKYKERFYSWTDKEMLLGIRKSNFNYKITKLGEIK